MKKKKIVLLIGSLQASLISPVTSVWNIEGKLKEKLKDIYYLLFQSLTPNVFVPELDIMNMNFTSQVLYVYKMFTAYVQTYMT